MSIEPIGPKFISDPESSQITQPAEVNRSFTQTLKDSIQQVNTIQSQADQTVVNLMTGKDQDLHETLIALEKASISFQLMMQVRNKIVTAYEEIFRMQI